MTKEEHILMQQVAKRIRDLRRENKLSQRLMSYDTDLNIGRIEACQNVVSLATIIKICKYFKISIAEFFKDFTE